ncbi:hypothetical protein EON66_09995 [archaeon]|nr:MAG: hypothetical protein EON66_09995 [archaeon]
MQPHARWLVPVAVGSVVVVMRVAVVVLHVAALSRLGHHAAVAHGAVAVRLTVALLAGAHAGVRTALPTEVSVCMHACAA